LLKEPELIYRRIFRMKRWKPSRLMDILVLFLMLPANPGNAADRGVEQALLKRMESAYEAVRDYRVHVHVVLAAGNDGLRTEEFVYTFRKPNQVRMDFKTPQPGTILVFPDKEGKVLVRPWGWRLLDLRLAPDSLLLSNPSGQRIDRSDFGLLIRNMGRSMNGGRRGPLEVIDEDPVVRIGVLAEDHFREGKITRYQFAIDRNTWFPKEIEERTPDGVLERRITFMKLEINTGVPDSFFHP
jgi:hypothetical protein